ncbi:uncharacterized protein LOC129770308 [Toxorhynchites rutilus septentrionalis]|uniref:uncharacterized protein LOC129770308 n=1 Tax=Toxorhynchites rutilus septentrionalis TaxID=329112 RepID=UPI002479FD78|nr:uncharacterized protein LOC129770308 [Toxorhynchites rutilus septentrionalis]
MNQPRSNHIYDGIPIRHIHGSNIGSSNYNDTTFLNKHEPNINSIDREEYKEFLLFKQQQNNQIRSEGAARELNSHEDILPDRDHSYCPSKENDDLNFSEVFKPQSQNIENNFIPYIEIKTLFGNLKFLVDTGANKNYISPKHVHPEKQKTEKLHHITNVSGLHRIDKFTEMNIFFNFESLPNQKFLLFQFHEFFDGLIGYESLRALGAIIDTASNELRIGNLTIPVKRKTCSQTEINFHTIFNKSETSSIDDVDYVDSNILIESEKCIATVCKTLGSLSNLNSNSVITKTDLQKKHHLRKQTATVNELLRIQKDIRNKQKIMAQQINETFYKGSYANHAQSRRHLNLCKFDRNKNILSSEMYRTTSNKLFRWKRQNFENLKTEEMFLIAPTPFNNAILSSTDYKHVVYGIKDNEENSFNPNFLGCKNDYDTKL